MYQYAKNYQNILNGLSDMAIFGNWTRTRKVIIGQSSKVKISIHHENTYIKFHPFKPHFYIVKLGFTGVYIIFLFLLKNIDCGYSL